MQKQEDLLQKNSNRSRNEFCVSSKCDDDYHILIWDFDNIDIYYVKRSLSQVQNFHKLNDIYLIKSSHGFNAFCLDKFWVNEAYNILFYTRWNDFNHIRVGFLGESWCLKMNDIKKIIYRIIPTDNIIYREQSNAHFEFFNRFFNFKGLRIYTPDTGYNVLFESYKQNRI